MPCIFSLGDERVHLPLRTVADTPFHIQGDDLIKSGYLNCVSNLHPKANINERKEMSGC